MIRSVDMLPGLFWRCVAQEDGKYTLTRPWSEGEYVYASDGRIIVRTPGELVAPNPEWRFPRNPEHWFNRHAKAFSVLPVDWAAARKFPCYSCCGDNDENPGWIVCESCSHRTRCFTCDGTGKSWEFDGRYRLAGRYAKLLMEFGARLYIPHDDHKPARFRIGASIAGCIMPLRREGGATDNGQ